MEFYCFMENQILADFRNESEQKFNFNERKVKESQERLRKTTPNTPVNQRFEVQSDLYQAYLDLFVLEYEIYLSAGELNSEFQLKNYKKPHTFFSLDLVRNWNLEMQFGQYHSENTQLMEDIRGYIYQKVKQARDQSGVRMVFDIESGKSSLILQNRLFTSRHFFLMSWFNELEEKRNFGMNQIKFTLMLYHRICSDLAKIKDWNRTIRIL